MVSFSFRNAPWRVDDDAFKASDKAQTVTMTCEEQPAIIIEAPIEAEKKKPEAA
jgi:hypothetical protein